ncbi:MAG: imelysin family protein [Polyangiaceae bacterium]
MHFALVGPISTIALVSAVTLSTPGLPLDPRLKPIAKPSCATQQAGDHCPLCRTPRPRWLRSKRQPAALAASPDATSLKERPRRMASSKVSWRRSEAFFLGPVDTETLGAKIETWPVLSTDLDTIVAGADTIDETYIASLGTNKKGFYALEILLFDNENGDSAVLSALSGDTNQRRRDLVAALAADMATNATKLSDAWDPSKGNFSREFAEAGKGSTTYDTQKKALDALVNAALRASEIVVSTGLAEPIGKRNNGVPEPDEQRAARSDNTRQDLLDMIAGVQAVYTCTRDKEAGTSLSAAVRDKTPSIDDAFNKHLADTTKALDAIPTPFADALSNNLTVLEAAYDQSNDLKRSLQTEISSVLGVTLAFNDTDGD